MASALRPTGVAGATIVSNAGSLTALRPEALPPGAG
jgi:hypothetical protein